jgi:undecaprenyl diphosphate synthase
VSGNGSSEREKDLLRALSQSEEIPRHVAVIMDGNGRWAAERRLPRWKGHREGMKAVRLCVEGAIEAGLGHLTLYAFSRENWERPAEEVSALMSLLVEFVDRERLELRERGVRARVFGDLSRLSEPALRSIRLLEETTRAGDRLGLNIAISYGARDEILRAARRLAEEVAAGRLAPAEIDAERLEAELWTVGIPDPDLLIRTSGEMRVSNFLLWQIAYAEIYVTPVLWPDFGKAELFEALLDFGRRDRRFGRVSA